MSSPAVSSSSSWIRTLHWAVTRNYPAIVKRLLENNSDEENQILLETMQWTSPDECPLHAAAALGLDDMVRLLIAAGIDINSYSVNKSTGTRWSALHWAVYYNRVSTVKLLVELGADINARGTYWTPENITTR